MRDASGAFSFRFIPFSFINPLFYALKHKKVIYFKISRFFLAVPNILRTFAIGYKIVVIYSAMATVSPRLHAVGFFYAYKVSFPGSGKRSFQYGGCMIRKILALRWESYHLITNGECDRHHCIYTSRSVYNGYKMAIMQNSILLMMRCRLSLSASM